MANDRLAKLEEMQKADPQDPFLIYAIALEYMGKGDFEAALHHFLRLNAMDPDYLPQYFQLGQLYEGMNEHSEAAAAYERGISLAVRQREQKTLNELRQALELLSED
ncbi:MAG: tetratricopeptide repeat protein [Bacteroidia bacterium]